MARQLISERDPNDKPIKTERLTYIGYYSGTTRKGEEYHADFEIGRYQRPRIVHNGNITYNPKGAHRFREDIIRSRHYIHN